MPKRRDVEEQRARLSAAVWSVLARDGLSGLTLRAVAARAGCTTGLVLHAFRDKRALLRHARELLHERTGRRADAAQEAAGEPLDALRAVALQALSLTAEGREEARVWVGFLAAAVSDEELRELHVQHDRAFVQRVEQLLAAARPDLPRAARTHHAVGLVALVEGFNTLAAADPQTYSPHRQRAAVDRLVDSLRA
ncbi:AcrR family transcriptional regulator [Kineococcus radiotolerans]|uniref:AcrR family transcriptional regulator n=1 Tax=Kineococcus radiotolerans TaxID=131568 RepID=A0A7W4TQ74_KINRA|nr:TetR/AcrR family transcriptional regulator [Kineococcus radiotolerans]MBB2902668.1 AcrR family transcriptional regulator [Kineococcus radiotolerans]